MTTFTVEAKFVGEDWSMGYRTNKKYKLYIHRFNFFERLVVGTDMAITPVSQEVGIPGYRTVPYKTIETFLQNWSNVKKYE